MVDLSDIDNGGIGRNPFAQFTTSKLAEAASGLSSATEAMRGATGSSRLQEIIQQMTLGSRALQGSDLISEHMRAITAPLGQHVRDRLAELGTANEVLRDAINNPRLGSVGLEQDLIERLNHGPDIGEYLEFRDFPEPFTPPIEFSPNPILETNALLEKLASDFEDMKTVTAATADVQEKQATLISELLKAAVEGAAAQQKTAEEQQKAAVETLRVARVSMWISLAAVMLTFAGIGVQALLS